MKAWCVFTDDPSEGCALVYAETRNRARVLGASEIDTEYRYTSAKRCPTYDACFDTERIVMDNHELPDNVPDFFYSDFGEA